MASSGGQCVCLVPYDAMQDVLAQGMSVNVNGQAYTLNPEAEVKTVIISEDTNPYIRVASGLNLGDVAVEIPMTAELADGVYQGSVLTESLQPISLLLR